MAASTIDRNCCAMLRKFQIPGEGLMQSAVLQRPFHFITVLWGRSYTTCFLEYCVPSFLAPGNLPSLSTAARSKFLIATTRPDWEQMQAAPIFRDLQRYVDTVFLEIPPCPPDRSGCEHMGVGHQAACKIAHDEKAYGIVFTPDSMISDGTIANLQKHALAGVELVWVSALRFAEESFLGHLKAFGLIPQGSRAASCAPIAVSGRDMVLAAMNGLHTETLTYEWDASYFPHLPSAVWFRVPGENGMVLHCLSWAPFLMDFGAVKAHDTSCLETWTIDGDYVFKNLGDNPKIHVVTDSDEMFYSSWAPYDDRPARMEPRYTSRFGWVNSLRKAAEFREAFYGPVFDPLKRKIFFQPVRWHANPLNGKWRKVERRSWRVLRLALSGPDIGLSWSPFSLLAGPVAAGVAAWRTCARITTRIRRVAGVTWQQRAIIWQRLRAFSILDARSRKRAIWRVKQAWSFVRTGQYLPELPGPAAPVGEQAPVAASTHDKAA